MEGARQGGGSGFLGTCSLMVPDIKNLRWGRAVQESRGFGLRLWSRRPPGWYRDPVQVGGDTRVVS